MIAQLLFLYGICNKFSFIIIRIGTYQPYLFSFAVFRKQDFFNLSLIIPDHFIGYIQEYFVYCDSSVPALPLLHHHNLSETVGYFEW